MWWDVESCAACPYTQTATGTSASVGFAVGFPDDTGTPGRSGSNSCRIRNMSEEKSYRAWPMTAMSAQVPMHSSALYITANIHPDHEVRFTRIYRGRVVTPGNAKEI